jgi:hypothetical protein
MLVQFYLPAVHALFNEFVMAKKYQITLHEWDEFCASVLPDLTKSVLNVPLFSLIRESKVNLVNLLEKKGEKLNLPSYINKCRSYSQWYTIVSETMDDYTWTKVSLQSQSTLQQQSGDIPCQFNQILVKIYMTLSDCL